MTKKIETHEEFLQTLADIKVRMAIKDAQILANPKPYLNAMHVNCRKLIKVLDDIEQAIMPYPTWEDADLSKARTITDDSVMRINKAMGIISDYKRNKES